MIRVLKVRLVKVRDIVMLILKKLFFLMVILELKLGRLTGLLKEFY